MNIDVEIERIENGFIVTDRNNRKKFFSTMRQFVDCQICAAIDCADEYFCEHDLYGAKRRLIFAVTIVE